MSTQTPSSSTDTRIIVNQLNGLLGALQIPTSLQSPTGLTPSLLIAILESLLSIHIPIVDQSQSHDINNVQCAKVFLGVLETDVLKMDVGLSEVDPRRLAKGEMEECIYVAELLCWVGSRLGLIQSQELAELAYNTPTAHSDDVGSPSTSTMTRQTFTSFNTNSYEESNTSMYSSGPSTPKNASQRSAPVPGCIHELPTPSSLLSPNSEHSFSSHDSLHQFDEQPSLSYEPTVRYTGYISPVDQELELRLFDLSRTMSSEMSFQDINEAQLEPTYSLHALRESHALSLELYTRRAQLLDEIAQLKHGKPPPFREPTPPG